MATNKFLTALIEDGADAMSNMYDVYIKFPGSDAGKIMTVRAEGFKIPEAEIDTYEVKYHGTTYTKPKSEMKFDRKFSLTFRLDAGYNLLNTFKAWHAMVVNPVTGGVSNVAAALGEVEVEALAQNFIADESTSNFGMKDWTKDDGSVKGAIKKWKFTEVWVNKVSQPEYKTEGGDKITFTVDFIFGNFNESDYGDLK